jgi:hypothetical protein
MPASNFIVIRLMESEYYCHKVITMKGFDVFVSRFDLHETGKSLERKRFGFQRMDLPDGRHDEL